MENINNRRNEPALPKRFRRSSLGSGAQSKEQDYYVSRKSLTSRYRAATGGASSKWCDQAPRQPSDSHLDDEKPPDDDYSDEEVVVEESPFKKQDSAKQYVFDFNAARKDGKMQRRHSETSVMGWTLNQSISNISTAEETTTTKKQVINKLDRPARRNSTRHIVSMLSASTPELDTSSRTRQMKRRGSTSSIRMSSASCSDLSLGKALLADSSRGSGSTYSSYTSQLLDESSGDSAPRRRMARRRSSTNSTLNLLEKLGESGDQDLLEVREELKNDNFKAGDILPPSSRGLRSRSSSLDEEDEGFLDGLIFMAPNSEDSVRSMMGQLGRRYSIPRRPSMDS